MLDDIEAFIDGEIELEFADSESIGRIHDYAHGMENYISFIESVVQTPLKGLKIVLDNANGSAVSSSQKAFEDLGAQVHVMHSEPNGVNINYHCGSTHPESLMEKVKAYGGAFHKEGKLEELNRISEQVFGLGNKVTEANENQKELVLEALDKIEEKAKEENIEL